ncbi:hypothetical protein EJB05_00746, partial [Eragrostis curvula]
MELVGLRESLERAKRRWGKDDGTFAGSEQRELDSRGTAEMALTDDPHSRAFNSKLSVMSEDIYTITMASSPDGEGDTTMPSALPEERLNIALLITAFGYKVMNSIGMLATIWATVVLLGGFSTLIKKQDFWYVTVIAFVQSFGK